MRIVIDLQGAQSSASRNRGVGRYTLNLVRALLCSESGHEYVLALNGALADSVDDVRSALEPYLGSNRIVVWQQYLSSASRFQKNPAVVDLCEIHREAFFNSFDPDVIFSTNLQEGYAEDAVTSVRRIPSRAAFVTVLHDLVPHHCPQYITEGDPVRPWYEKKIAYATASTHIITDSEASKTDITTLLGVSSDRIHVAECGYDCEIFKAVGTAKINDPRSPLKSAGAKKVILYAGGGDDHKNLPRLIAAFGALSPSLHQGHSLVLVGGGLEINAGITEALRRIPLSAEVMLPGFVEDELLAAMMRSCACFVFPSTHEGFGLPALEAMACGAPVIGSRSSAVGEMIARQEAMFDPLNVKSISTLISRVLADEGLRLSLVENGLRRCADFSWEKTASRVLEVFRRCEKVLGRESERRGLENALEEVFPYLSRVNDADLAALSRGLHDTYAEPRHLRRLHIDISTVVKSDCRTGIQRVTRAVISALSAKDINDLEVVCVFSRADYANFYVASDYMREAGLPLDPSITGCVEFLPGDILLFLDLAPAVLINYRDRLRNLRHRGVQVHTVVYDLLPIALPRSFELGLPPEFKRWLYALSTLDGAVCISRSVADQLRDYLEKHGSSNSGPLRIGYFHLGADLENSIPTSGIPEDASSVLEILSGAPTFLMVGTVEPRKGHRQVIEAFELLWKNGVEVNLAIVGKIGWLMDGFKESMESHPFQGSRLFHLNGVSDEYLDHVYEVSDCLIAASSGEGFGLPLVEAARKGIPIIARELPVFREVAGDHAMYFEDSREPCVITAVVRRWLELSTSDAHPKSDGIRALSWSESADQLLHVILESRWLHTIKGRGALQDGLSYGANSPEFRWSGFSPNKDGSMELNKKGSLRFHLEEPFLGENLRILLRQGKSTNLQVTINGRHRYESLPGAVEYALAIPLGTFQSGENTLRFEHLLENDQESAAIREIEIVSMHRICSPSTIAPASSEVVWSGFSNPEKEWRWTCDDRAEIQFCIAAELDGADLGLVFDIFGTQAFSILLNGNEIYREKHSANKMRLDFSGVLRSGPNTLVFNLPEAHAPGEHDNRLLGVAIRSILINLPSR
jgi:glycosyltransferase involved in cell wall biosynthesis